MKNTIIKTLSLMVMVFVFVDGLDAQRGRAARSSAKTASGGDGEPNPESDNLPSVIDDIESGKIQEIKVSDKAKVKAASGKTKSARLAGQKVDTSRPMKNYVSLGEGNWYRLWGKGIKVLGWVKFDPRKIPQTRQRGARACMANEDCDGFDVWSYERNGKRYAGAVLVEQDKFSLYKFPKKYYQRLQDRWSFYAEPYVFMGDANVTGISLKQAGDLTVNEMRQELERRAQTIQMINGRVKALERKIERAITVLEN